MTTTVLISKLEAVDISVDEHYIVFSTLDTEVGRRDLESIHGELVGLKFTKPLELEKDSGRLQLVVDTGTDSWSSRCPLYLTVKHFWTTVSNDDAFPDFYFICEGRLGSWMPAVGAVFKIKVYMVWKSILRDLSDHKGTSSSAGTFVYFISTEKGAKKHEVNPAVTLVKLESLEINESIYDVAVEIRALVDIKDAHIRERRDVLRTTLSEILDEDHKDSSFEWLVTQCKRFEKKFRENYDIYVHRFSVNKLLGEIEEKVSDYISKINESVSSSQNKAFAIPGALIAVAALIKEQSALSILLVCVGLYFVMLLTKTANSIYFESFSTLESQIKKSLSRYEVIKDEAEVRVSAEEAKTKLLELLKNARRRIGTINRLATYTFVLGVFYSLCVFLGKDFLQFFKSYVLPVLIKIAGHVTEFESFDRWEWLKTIFL